MTFPEYEWDTRYNSQIVDRCIEVLGMLSNTRIILKLAKFYAHVDSSSRRSSKYIIVILAAKAELSATANLKKVFKNKYDIDGQPEIAVWPSRPEVLLFPKV